MANILTPEEILDLAINAGFDFETAQEAVAVALVESVGDAEARNSSGAFGLWQIRGEDNIQWLIKHGSKHGLNIESAEDLLDPANNALAAYLMTEKASYTNRDPRENESKYEGIPYKWIDWSASYPHINDFTLWHERDDNTESAMEAAQRVFAASLYGDGKAPQGRDLQHRYSEGRIPILEDEWDLNLDESWSQKMLRFVTASGGKVIPAAGRVGADIYPDWINRIGNVDRGVADAMGTARDSKFPDGLAALLNFSNGEGRKWAQSNAGRYGIHLNSEFPELAGPLGSLRHHREYRAMNRLSKPEIAQQLMEVAEGNVHYGTKQAEPGEGQVE
jgi:hypothetical protein